MMERQTLLALVAFMVVAIVVIFIGGYFCGVNVAYAQRGQKNINTGPSSEKLTEQTGPWYQQPCFPERNICPSDFRNPPLLLISLDGFRPDYFAKTPTLKRLAHCGASAPYMKPVFPTKTFPNHYSIVTGLYPESHGIIDNNIYDPKLRRLFSVRRGQDNYNPIWWEAEPLWVTAEKQGKITGTYFWPGSEIKINGTRPTYYIKYNNKVSWKTRLETILSWLELPEESRPSFLTLYINEPDHASHAHGPESPQVNAVLAKLDSFIELMITSLQQRNLLGCINIIIVSDHGMAKSDCNKVIELDNYINSSEVFLSPGPIGRIRPKGKRTVESVVEILRCNRPELLVYKKNDLPKRYHYSYNNKIEPIIVDLPSGWAIENKFNARNCRGGNHGYDYLHPEMNAIFLAFGPSFKKNLLVEPFINIELYELMAELIDVIPNPNNGTKGSLHYILNNPMALSASSTHKAITACVITNLQSSKFKGCNCPNGSLHQISPPSDFKHKQEVILPWGAPMIKDSESTSICHLMNPDYVTAFHKKLKQPAWISFPLTRKTSIMSGEARFFHGKCWILDQRIPFENQANCTDYSILNRDHSAIQQRSLFPPAFASSANSESSVQLMTNAVPMYKTFYSEIWTQFLILLSKWTQKYDSLNIIMGPAFDERGNGLKMPVGELLERHNNKIPIPTHYFAVITRCEASNVPLNSCRSADLDVLSFLIPHKPFPENCQNINEYFLKHSATVKDIEVLTGLKFFTSLSPYTAIALQTRLTDYEWFNVK
ncbi:venom phosphodiesterase 2-like isoform X1 [Centruroides vittatus]|uniref:venom phosphodiesterase 2-like isoform X1 n=2 Tax=Centruroides vittatus TaxID=120091 RepID=UPI0035102E25